MPIVLFSLEFGSSWLGGLGFLLQRSLSPLCPLSEGMGCGIPARV